jgi:hypothetical protein
MTNSKRKYDVNKVNIVYKQAKYTTHYNTSIYADIKVNTDINT